MHVCCKRYISSSQPARSLPHHGVEQGDRLNEGSWSPSSDPYANRMTCCRHIYVPLVTYCFGRRERGTSIMTPPPMPTSILKKLAAAMVAVLILGIVATWSSFRGDRADPEAARGSIRVVAAKGDMVDEKAGLSSALTATSLDVDPATALQTLLASSFPGLSNVETQCAERLCDIKATATVPAGGKELADYEKMIRSDIAATLQRDHYALTELPQVEEVGDGSARVIYHVSIGR